MNSPSEGLARDDNIQALPHYVSTSLDEALAAFMADPGYVIRMAEDARRVQEKAVRKRLARRR